MTADAAMESAQAHDTDALVAGILQRMNESGGFPALDHSVARIVEAIEMGEMDTTPLVNAVLADVSLTQKVLRLANSAMYAPIGRSVSTISHAMMVLGFEAVGHLALGVKLIGSMGQMHPVSPGAERALAHSLAAGSVAATVVGRNPLRNGEMGVVCTLLHRVGRLLTAFYLPEEWDRIQRLVASGRDESAAAQEVLGLALEELGMRIARQWRLPDRIVHTMGGEAAPTASPEDAQLAALARFSDRSASFLVGEGGENDVQLRALAEEFGPSLGLEPESLTQAVKAASEEISAQPMLAEILVENPPRATLASAPKDPLAMLAAGVVEVGQVIAEGGDVQEIAGMISEVAFRCLGLGRVAVLLDDPDTGSYRVQATLAARNPNRLAGASLPLETGGDLAALALARRVDIYIDNPRDEKIAASLPGWIRSQGTHPFFLLPIIDASGRPRGLFHGQQQDDEKLGKGELQQLAALRDLLQSRLGAAG